MWVAGPSGIDHQSRSTGYVLVVGHRESLCVGDYKGTHLESFCHSETFPRQARLLALFFLSGWRPAPERDRAATAIMLRRFGIFVLLRLAIMWIPFD